jgi:Carboxypeptidase regulatory-like domain
MRRHYYGFVWIRLRLALAAFVVLVVAGTTAAPQSGRPRATGSIAGQVKDLPGAIITARTYGYGSVKVATASSDGRYELNGLPDGVYQVDAAHEGFDIGRRNGVTVRGGPVPDVDFTLGAMSVCECLDVRRPGAPVILQGTITDGRGHALPHARLTLSGDREGPLEALSAKAYADSAGRFRTRVPENRVYVLTSASPGFVTQRTTIRVREAARGAMTITIDMVTDTPPTDLAAIERLSQGCLCEGDVFIHERR